MNDKIFKNINNDFIEMNFSKVNKDKNIFYIFGKNASGKTTFSQEVDSINDIEKFIFNRDYIAKNLFVDKLAINEISESSFNILNKKNTYEIFLGKDLKDSITKYNELVSKRGESIKNVNKYLKDYKPEFSSIINEFDFNFGTAAGINGKKLNESSELVEQVKNDISEKYKILNISDKLSNLNNKVNNAIQAVNTSINKKLNEYFAITKNSVHKDIYQIHEIAKESELDVIRFAGEDFPKQKIVDEFNKMEIEKVKIKEFINQYSKSQINAIDSIKKDSLFNDYLNINEDTKNMLNDLDNYLKNIMDEINVQETKDFENNYNFDVNDIKTEINQFLVENKYSILSNLDNLKEEYNKMLEMGKEIKNTNQEILDKQEDLNNDAINKINKYLEMLGSEELEVNLKSNMALKNATSTIGLVNKDISKLSEGEKKCLALAYFLSDLETNLKHVDKNTVVFIDDPFDSNDHFKVDRWRDVEIDNDQSLPSYICKTMQDKGLECKLIISTHNTSVLSSLIINGIDKDKENNKYAFKVISKSFLENIQPLYIDSHSKEGKTISDLNELNLSHFYPNDNTLLIVLEEEIKLIHGKELSQIDDKDINNLRVLICALVKVLDLHDGKRRNNLILLVNDILRLETVSKPKKEDKCFNRNISDDIFCKIKSLENMELIIYEDKLQFKKIEDAESLKEYLKRSIEIINKAFNNKDENMLKRLRHKNNIHSTIIGYGIEE